MKKTLFYLLILILSMNLIWAGIKNTGNDNFNKINLGMNNLNVNGSNLDYINSNENVISNSNNKVNYSFKKNLNLIYDSKKNLKLDIYSTGIDNAPTLVHIHGGGFSAGSKLDNYILNDVNYFTNKGINVVSIDYTLANGLKNPNTAYPVQLKNIDCAMRWLYDHANKFNLNINNFNLIGTSAGGNLVLLYSLNQKSYFDTNCHSSKNYPKIKKIIDIAGPTDMYLSENKLDYNQYSNNVRENFLGKYFISENFPYFKDASPLYQVLDNPKVNLNYDFLMIYSKKDELVNYSIHAVPFYIALVQKGANIIGVSMNSGTHEQITTKAKSYNSQNMIYKFLKNEKLNSNISSIKKEEIYNSNIKDNNKNKCVINSIHWIKSDILAHGSSKFEIKSSNCIGKNIKLKLKEEDLIFDDFVRNKNILISLDKQEFLIKDIPLSDYWGDSEYYLDFNNIKSNILIVKPSLDFTGIYKYKSSNNKQMIINLEIYNNGTFNAVANEKFYLYRNIKLNYECSYYTVYSNLDVLVNATSGTDNNCYTIHSNNTKISKEEALAIPGVEFEDIKYIGKGKIDNVGNLVGVFSTPNNNNITHGDLLGKFDFKNRKLKLTSVNFDGLETNVILSK